MTQPLPEVHLIGEILNGDGFSSANAFAKLTIESGEEWDCAGGDESGQTQVEYPGMVCVMLIWSIFHRLSILTTVQEGIYLESSD